MGGVDKVHQHIANNPVTRKRGKKYYKKYFSIYLKWLSGMHSSCTRNLEEERMLLIFVWQ
jgi:hypothetical protein